MKLRLKIYSFYTYSMYIYPNPFKIRIFIAFSQQSQLFPYSFKSFTNYLFYFQKPKNLKKCKSLTPVIFVSFRMQKAMFIRDSWGKYNQIQKYQI